MVDYINLLVAAVNVAVAVFLALEARRIGLPIPRLVLALVLFFVLTGAARVNHPDPLFGYNASLAAAFDGASLLVLAFLLVNVRRLARTAVATLDEARYRAHEYERARRDYRQLVRHRILNPVTAIRGCAYTLQTEAGADPELRDELVRAILDASRVLEQVTVEPDRRGPEERGLRPLPRV